MVFSLNPPNFQVIEGMGELHLEIIIDRLKREFKVGFSVAETTWDMKRTIEIWIRYDT